MKPGVNLKLTTFEVRISWPDALKREDASMDVKVEQIVNLFHGICHLKRPALSVEV